MELNKTGFQTEDKDRLAEELYRLRSRRQFCLFEMDNELFAQKRIGERRERAKMELRLHMMVFIPLTLFSLYNSLYMIINIADAALHANKHFALHSFPLGILGMILIIPCILGWRKIVKLALSLATNGSRNLFDEDWRKSQTKINNLKSEKDSLDIEIQQKGIAYAKLKEEKDHPTALDDAKKKQNSDNMDESKQSMFSLRNDKDDSEEIKNEHKYEIQKCINRAKDNIAAEKNKIIQTEIHIRELETEYKKAKLIITEFAIGLILIFILQNIPGGRMDAILAVCAYISIFVLAILYTSKYKKIIDEYHFEQNPTLYRSFGVSNGFEWSQVTIKKAKEEIFYNEQEIHKYEEKLRDISN